MKNLYERLKPEILEDIERDLEIYPISTKALVRRLQRTTYWSDLKISDVKQLFNHTHYNLLTISHYDLVWGDKFLISDDDDDYTVSITG